MSTTSKPAKTQSVAWRLAGHALRGLTWPTRAVVIQRRSRVLLLLTLASGLAVAAVYRHQTLSELPFAVVDDDGTGITRTLELSLDATRELAVVRGMPDFAAASDAVERGELAGALWLPEGFTGAIKRGEAARAALLVDGRNILVSKVAQRAAQTVLTTVGVGVEMTIARKTGLGPDAALGRAAPIALSVDRPWNPRGSYAVYLAPALLLFNVHLFCLLFAAFLLAPPTPERARSRVHPPLGHPVARAAALVGAVIPAAGVLALFVGVVLPWLGMPVAGAPGPLVAFGLAFIGVSLLEAATLRAVIPSPAMATQATAVIGALSMMLSGATFTIDLFPGPLQALARALPLTPAADALRGVVAAPELAAIAPADWAALAEQATLFGLALAGALLVRAAVRGVRGLVHHRHDPAEATR